MKTEIIGKLSSSKTTYPIMKGKNPKDEKPQFIVLFTAANTGTCIVDDVKVDGKDCKGERRENWDEAQFTPLPTDMEVQLSNH